MRLPNTFIFVGTILLLVCLQIIQAQVPKGTPLDELLQIKDTLCKDRLNQSEVEVVRHGWSACIDNFILGPIVELEEEEELKRYYSYFCRSPSQFKSCWGNVTQLLNACDPGRGDTAEKVYFAIYDVTCKDNGAYTSSSIIKSMQHGRLCELNYLTEQCTSSKKDFYARDLCRRYEAQNICEGSSIEGCVNGVHSEVLLRKMHEIGESLNCLKDETTSSSSMTTMRRGSQPITFVTIFSIVSTFFSRNFK